MTCTQSIGFWRNVFVSCIGQPPTQSLSLWLSGRFSFFFFFVVFFSVCVCLCVCVIPNRSLVYLQTNKKNLFQLILPFFFNSFVSPLHSLHFGVRNDDDELWRNSPACVIPPGNHTRKKVKKIKNKRKEINDPGSYIYIYTYILSLLIYPCVSASTCVLPDCPPSFVLVSNDSDDSLLFLFIILCFFCFVCHWLQIVWILLVFFFSFLPSFVFFHLLSTLSGEKFQSLSNQIRTVHWINNTCKDVFCLIFFISLCPSYSPPLHMIISLLIYYYLFPPAILSPFYVSFFVLSLSLSLKKWSVFVAWLDMLDFFFF